MKAKKTTTKAKMTDAEIKEAVRRDKEWMDDISSEDEIEVPPGGWKGLIDGEGEEGEGNAEPEANDEDASQKAGDESGEIDDNDGEDCSIDDDNDLELSGAGGVLGAIVGGVGGVVLGGILGAALFDD